MRLLFELVQFNTGGEKEFCILDHISNGVFMQPHVVELKSALESHQTWKCKLFLINKSQTQSKKENFANLITSCRTFFQSFFEVTGI